MITTTITSRFAAIAVELEQASAAAVQQAAQDYRDKLEAAMQAPKTGVLYGSHQASAPGEAPASDTGDYLDSITVQPTGPYTVVVATDAVQAPILEYGDGFIEPRPMWEPVAQEIEKTFAQDQADRMREAA